MYKNKSVSKFWDSVPQKQIVKISDNTIFTKSCLLELPVRLIMYEEYDG